MKAVKSHEQIKALTAESAREIVKNLVDGRIEFQTAQLVSFFNDEIRGAAEKGDLRVDLSEPPFNGDISAAALDRAVDDLRSRGFVVFDESGVDDSYSDVIDYFAVSILWDKPAKKGKKK